MSRRPRPPQYEDPAEGMLNHSEEPPAPRDSGKPRHPPEDPSYTRYPPRVIDADTGEWLGLALACGFSGAIVGALIVVLVWWLS